VQRNSEFDHRKNRKLVAEGKQFIPEGEQLVTNVVKLRELEGKSDIIREHCMKAFKHAGESRVTERDVYAATTVDCHQQRNRVLRGWPGSPADKRRKHLALSIVGADGNGASPERAAEPRYVQGASSIETGIFATLGLVGFAAVVLAFVSAFAPGGYIHSGELPANARTAAAMVRYLLEPEPEPVVVKNVIAVQRPQTNLGSPPNVSRIEPKA